MVACQVREFIKSLERKGTCHITGSNRFGVALYIEVASIRESCHSFEDLNSTFERIRKSSAPLNLPKWGRKEDLCALFERLTHRIDGIFQSSKTVRLDALLKSVQSTVNCLVKCYLIKFLNKSELNKITIKTITFRSVAFLRFQKQYVFVLLIFGFLNTSIF